MKQQKSISFVQALMTKKKQRTTRTKKITLLRQIAKKKLSQKIQQKKIKSFIVHQMSTKKFLSISFFLTSFEKAHLNIILFSSFFEVEVVVVFNKDFLYVDAMIRNLTSLFNTATVELYNVFSRQTFIKKLKKKYAQFKNKYDLNLKSIEKEKRFTFSANLFTLFQSNFNRFHTLTNQFETKEKEIETTQTKNADAKSAESLIKKKVKSKNSENITKKKIKTAVKFKAKKNVIKKAKLVKQFEKKF